MTKSSKQDPRYLLLTAGIDLAIRIVLVCTCPDLLHCAIRQKCVHDMCISSAVKLVSGRDQQAKQWNSDGIAEVCGIHAGGVCCRCQLCVQRAHHHEAIHCAAACAHQYVRLHSRLVWVLALGCAADVPDRLLGTRQGALSTHSNHGMHFTAFIVVKLLLLLVVLYSSLYNVDASIAI